MSVHHFKNQLNPMQLEAVTTLDGPVLVLAGAGSGKTRVLTYRMAELILQGKATASQILCVTFTNKATREMKERIFTILKNLDIPLHEPLWVATFHSACVRILRENIHHLDYNPQFVIYDSSDQIALLKKTIISLGLETTQNTPKSFQTLIQKAKRLAFKPSDHRLSQFMSEKQRKAYAIYEDELKLAHALDFSDLLLKTYELFKKYPEVLKTYQDQFSYIMIDEYQDTNHLQYEIIKMLSLKHKNLCAVGDEDQSIYGWRGADLSHILNFEKDFNDRKIIKLEQNYRSTKSIVEAANILISHNLNRKEKKLFTKNKKGELISICQLDSEYAEARFIAQTIQKQRVNWPLKKFAVFYRTNAQSRVLEEELRRHGLPYKIIGGTQFYDRKEIKDMLAYMKWLYNPQDNISLKRIINTPTRGLGKTTLDKLESFSTENKISLHNAIPLCCEKKMFHKGTQSKLKGFHELMENLKTLTSEASPQEAYLHILEATKYTEFLKTDDPFKARGRIENVEELHNALVQFEGERKEEASLGLFLEELTLMSKDEDWEDEDHVTLMTLHISKGLEFPVVFIAGLEEGLCPSSQALSSEDSDSLEEERRVFYVGMTRAQEKLYLTYSETRKFWGSETRNPPSRFLMEIPQEYIEYKNERAFSSFSQPKTPKKDSEFDMMPEYEDFSDEEGGWKKGMQVKHPLFGQGHIQKVEGSGEDQKISVLFTNRSTKKFAARYAKLQKL